VVVLHPNDCALLSALVDDALERGSLARTPLLEERARALAADFAECAKSGQAASERVLSGDDAPMSPKAAAHALDMSVRTLRRRLASGALPSTKTNGRVKIRPEDVEALRGSVG
jgi:hypothetical protein